MHVFIKNYVYICEQNRIDLYVHVHRKYNNKVEIQTVTIFLLNIGVILNSRKGEATVMS